MPVLGMFGQSPRKRRRAPPAGAPVSEDVRSILPSAPSQVGIESGMAPFGLFGSGAPKKRSTSVWGDIAEAPFTFALGGMGGLDARRGRIEEEDALAEKERSRAEMLWRASSSGLQGQELLAFMNNPEEWAKSYSTNIEAANVNAGDSRLVNGAFMQAPRNPMAVAEGTDVFDPDAGKSVYSNTPAPKPPEPFTLGEGQTRFDPEGNVIASGPAKTTGEPAFGTSGLNKDQLQVEREMARNWDSIHADYTNVARQYQNIKSMGALAGRDKPARSAADLALIVSITKMLDPTSVAREGEVKLTQSSASLFDQVKNLPAQWEQGQTLLPDNTRYALLKVADELWPSYQKAYQNRARDTEKVVGEYGLAPHRVMMGYRAPAAPPANAEQDMDSLMANAPPMIQQMFRRGAAPQDDVSDLMQLYGD